MTETLTEKVGRLIEQAEPGLECYAVPGENHIIDMIDPATGLTCVYGKTESEVRDSEPGAVRMPFDDYAAAKAARQQTPIEWEPTTEERYHDMLGVLPPALWLGGAFLVGEPDDHCIATGQPRYLAFRHVGESYLCASRPITRAELRAVLAETYAAAEMKS